MTSNIELFLTEASRVEGAARNPVTLDDGSEERCRRFARTNFPKMIEMIRELESTVKFYANGGTDLEPRPEKAHLYAMDFPVNSPEWRQRSMSDYWSGMRARSTLAKLNGIVSEGK